MVNRFSDLTDREAEILEDALDLYQRLSKELNDVPATTLARKLQLEIQDSFTDRPR